MNFTATAPWLLALLVLSARTIAAPTDEPLREGSTISLAGKTVTVAKFDALPFVENAYSKRFKFDRFENPKLAELRSHYRLEEVVAPGNDEFARQVLLMDWTHRQFKKFGHPSTNSHGALEILQAIEDGHTFFCSQYAQVLVSAAASLGWVDRSLALRRHKGANANGGSTEHTSTEIWSNQYRKWVTLDPTSNLYVEKDGVPLNAYEIRQEWFYHEGKALTFVSGNKRYRKSDLPIRLEYFPGFGNLTFDPDEPDKYGFTAYIPNTDLMDSGFDYGKMFMVKDQLCDGTKWHIRDVPPHPATDCYFPIGQAALSLAPENQNLRVQIKTLTPNFARYETRFDGGDWKTSTDSFIWKIHPGKNRLEAKTINKFGVNGPVSLAELMVK